MRADRGGGMAVERVGGCRSRLRAFPLISTLPPGLSAAAIGARQGFLAVLPAVIGSVARARLCEHSRMTQQPEAGKLHAPLAFKGLPGATAAATSPRLRPACPSLRHPGPQHDLLQPPSQQQQGAAPGSLDAQAQQRVVGVLLRELDAARQQGAASQAELAALKAELLRRQEREKAGKGGPSAGSSSGGSAARPNGGAAAAPPAGRKQLSQAQRNAAAPTNAIKAFRPPGKAPPPRPQPLSARGRGGTDAVQPPEAANADELAALQRENEEMRGHLLLLLNHCESLQQQLSSAAAASAAPAAGRSLAGQAGPSSPARRPRSPGCTAAAVVLSPRADGSDLAVAVFQAPPENVGELRLLLNRTQRQNLKLSSKLAKAKEEEAERAAEARHWQQAVGAIGELRVDVEAGRRRQRDLEAALQAAAGQVAAAQEHGGVLLEQLEAAESAAVAAEGEASALRCQLAVTEEQRGRALTECERLKDEAASTAAKLSATDVVRREAERERDCLELHVHRLQVALDEADASEQEAAEGVAAQLAAARQELAVEQQRGEMLQAQLALAQSQARETERVLSEQLRAVQEERNACLAAATRADALLVRLGQHAMATRGVD